jgi:hypothetical protein
MTDVEDEDDWKLHPRHNVTGDHDRRVRRLGIRARLLHDGPVERELVRRIPDTEVVGIDARHQLGWNVEVVADVVRALSSAH